MKLIKSRQSKADDSPVNSRRSFIWKMGAGASAALTSVSGLAQAGTATPEMPTLDTVRAEEKRIRQLQQQFVSMMERGAYTGIHELFAADAEVTFNGGVFSGRDQGIRRFYSDIFRAGLSGKRIEQAPGFELDAEQQQDIVDVAADLQSASGWFTYSIQLGRPMDPVLQLVQMARLHGEGIHKWWEGGVYRVSYAKDVDSGDWKISSLVYDTLSRADYRQGRSYARPLSVEQFSVVFPEDQLGPDRLV